MAVTAKSVYRDSGNFFRNQFVGILLLAALCAFVTTLLVYSFSPSAEQIVAVAAALQKNSADSLSITDLRDNLSPEQLQLLVKIAAVRGVAALISNTLLAGGLLTLIIKVSNGERVSALSALGSSVTLLPRLFLLLFCVTLLVEIGTLFFVLPGLFLAVLLAMAPVIMVHGKAGIIRSLYSSASLVFRNMWLATSGVLFWFVLKYALAALFFPSITNQEIIGTIFMNGVGNMMDAWLLIYLFRLYTLIS